VIVYASLVIIGQHVHSLERSSSYLLRQSSKLSLTNKPRCALIIRSLPNVDDDVEP
jgi:hypothetical protein